MRGGTQILNPIHALSAVNGSLSVYIDGGLPRGGYGTVEQQAATGRKIRAVET